MSTSKSTPYIKFNMQKNQIVGSKLSERQKDFFSKIKPNVNIKRFQREKIADTGYDPQGSFIEFMKHDIIRPLNHGDNDKKLYDNFKPEVNLMDNKYALNTQKIITNKETLPKVQSYKEYNFINWDKVKEDNQKKAQEKTEEIYNKKCPFLDLKAKFGSHSECQHPWMPYQSKNSQNNRNSVAYNIITNGPNELCGKLNVKLGDADAYHKKKGICGFSDYTNPFNPNFNKEFGNLYQNNYKIFHNYHGIFSEMYDSAAKNGNIYMPFRRNKSCAEISKK